MVVERRWRCATAGGAAMLAAVTLLAFLPFESARAQSILGGLPLPASEIIEGRIYRPDGSFVDAITNGDQANDYVGAVAPALSFVGDKEAVVFRTTTETQFVRFYSPGQIGGDGSGPVGAWIAGTNAVRGLTAAKVKDVLALPFLPTAYTFARVPAGTCVLAAHGAPVLGNFPADPPDIPAGGPWGHGGTPQYYIIGTSGKAHCEDAQWLPDDDFFNRQQMGQRALAFGPRAGGGNVGKVAGVLDNPRSLPPLFSDMDGIYNSLDRINLGRSAPLRSALTQLSGEAYADIANVEIAGGWALLNVVREQMRVGRRSGARDEISELAAVGASQDYEAVGKGPLRWWLAGYGSIGDVAGQDGVHDVDFNLAGSVLGADYRINRDLMLGGAVSYSRGSFSTDGLSNNAGVDAYSGVIYSSYSPGRFYADSSVGFAYSEAEMTRDIVFPGVTRSASGDQSSNGFLSNIELGYHFAVGDRTVFTPLLGFQAIVVDQEGVSESGAGAIDLNIESEVNASARSLLGAELKHRFEFDGQASVELLLRVGWMHDFADTQRTITATFGGLPGSAFTVEGAEMPRDSALVGASVGIAGSAEHRLGLFANYDGIINGSSNSHAGSISLSWAF